MRTLFFLILMSPILHAQELEQPNPKVAQYTNTFLSGGSVGGSEELWGMSFSTFHGVKIKRWRLMAGVGMDGYSEWLTYPIMGSISFDVSDAKKRGSFYLMINSGYSLADKTNPIEWVSTFADSGGMIFNPMIGYRMRIGDVNLYFQSGYKNQKVSYSYSDVYGGWGDYPGNSNQFEIDQSLNRFVFQIGFGF